VNDNDGAKWQDSGKPVRGVGGAALVVGAVLWHILTLRWLTAPRWKNKTEAKAELLRLVHEHEGRTYEHWVEHIDQRQHWEFNGAAGNWYQASLLALWDDRPGGAVRVLISLDDGGVGAYHPMTDSLLIWPPEPTTGSAGQHGVEQGVEPDEAQANGRRRFAG